MSDFNLPETKVPTEDEMVAIRGLFARAADAIVNASNLNKRVTEMGDQITRLTAEVESINRYNRSLLEQITELRQKNTDLQQKLEDMQTEVSRSRQLMAQRDDEIKGLQDHVNAQADTIVRLQRESDDWQHKHNVLAAVQGTLRSKVSTVVDHVKDIDAALNPPPPAEPVVVPAPDWANPVGQLAGTGQAGDGDQPDPSSDSPSSGNEPTSLGSTTSSLEPEAEEYRPWPAFQHS